MNINEYKLITIHFLLNNLIQLMVLKNVKIKTYQKRSYILLNAQFYFKMFILL